MNRRALLLPQDLALQNRPRDLRADGSFRNFRAFDIPLPNAGSLLYTTLSAPLTHRLLSHGPQTREDILYLLSIS